jgi:thiol-disulfide isomerase/thioredoxin/predicted negative regulator of RcsB-dependent stress response
MSMRKNCFFGLIVLLAAIVMLPYCSGDSGASLDNEWAGLKEAYAINVSAAVTAEEKGQIEKKFLEDVSELLAKYEGHKLSAAGELARAQMYGKVGQFGKADAILTALAKDADENLKVEAYKGLADSLIRQSKLEDATNVLRDVKNTYKEDLAQFAGLFLRAGVNQRNSDLKTALELIDTGLGAPLAALDARALYYAIHIKFVDGGLDTQQLGEFLVKMKELYGSNERIDGQISKKERFLAFLGSDAPEFADNGTWVNVKQPLSIKKKKRKYILLDFYAPWCPDCRNSLPKFLELGQKLNGKMETVVVTRIYGFYADENTKAKRGIEPEEELKLVKEYLRMKKIDIPVFIADNGDMHDSFAASAIPHYVLVSPKGKVVKLCMERTHDFFTQVEEIVTQ